LAFIRVKGNELETIGAIKNNLSEEHIADILKITEAKDGDLILLELEINKLSISH